MGQASVWTGTELLIWGGMEVNSPGQSMASDGAAYDPVTRAWTPMPASPLSPRDAAFGVWTGTRALFWGGGSVEGALVQLIDGASYDPASRTWAMLPAAPLRPSATGQAVVWTGTQMVVIQPGAGAAFDPATSSWTMVPALPQVAGWQPSGITAYWTGSKVITWVTRQRLVTLDDPGGRTAGRPETPIDLSVSAYSWVPGSRAWAFVPSQPDYNSVPAGTAAPIGGWLLFPGNFGVAWYDPSSGTWTARPESSFEVAGPAVWTGSAMVEFGTGIAAAFDPSTDAWTGLASCPIVDVCRPVLGWTSLAWTGRQLIVVTLDDESGDIPPAPVEVLSSPVRHSK
jgi:hypothetical protein